MFLLLLLLHLVLLADWRKEQLDVSSGGAPMEKGWGENAKEAAWG